MPKRRRQRHWYEDLGLQGDPFAAPPATLFGDDARKQVLSRILQATSRTPPILVVTGPGGVGKSTLLRAARARAADDGLCLSISGNLFTDAAALTQQLWQALTEASGTTPNDSGSARELGQTLAAMSKERASIHLLVDDAGEYGDDCLDLLIGLGSSLVKRPFRVVLVGEEALADRLATHSKVARIRFESLPPLDDASTAAYLLTRLRDVSLPSGEPLRLTEDELGRVIRHAQGNPARIETEARNMLRSRVRRKSGRSSSRRSGKRSRSKKILGLSPARFAAAIGIVGALLVGAGLLMQPVEPEAPPIAGDEILPARPDEASARTGASRDREVDPGEGQDSSRPSAASTSDAGAARNRTLPTGTVAQIPATPPTTDSSVLDRAPGAERNEVRATNDSVAASGSESILRAIASFFSLAEETAANATATATATADDDESTEGRQVRAASGGDPAEGAIPIAEDSNGPGLPAPRTSQDIERREPPLKKIEQAVPPALAETTGGGRIDAEGTTPESVSAIDSIAETLEAPRTFGNADYAREGAPDDAIALQADARATVANGTPQAPADAIATGTPETDAIGPSPTPLSIARELELPRRPEEGTERRSTPDPDFETGAIAAALDAPASIDTGQQATAERAADAAMAPASTVEPISVAPMTTVESDRIALRPASGARDVLAARASLLDRLRGAEPASVATTAPASTLAEDDSYSGRLAGEREILGLPSDALMLQVMAVSSATRAAVWFTEQRGTGNYAVYAKGDGAERRWIVLQGPFQDRARAEAAAQDVERRTGVSNPWIRSVAEVQAEIDPI